MLSMLQACGTRHLPPTRVCLKCRAVDRMTPERMADVPATIATYTVDRLAYSLSPPVVVGVLDFEGGGPLHLRADRRGPRRSEDRQPGRDDVPPPHDRSRRAQLLLEV
jgi:uncharacterized OB-fold protein